MRHSLIENEKAKNQQSIPKKTRRKRKEKEREIWMNQGLTKGKVCLTNE